MFDDFNQCTGVPKTMDEEFIKKSTALFNHNFRILVHYLKSIDKTLVNELAILKTGGTIFDETKRRSFRRIMQTKRDTLSMLKKKDCASVGQRMRIMPCGYIKPSCCSSSSEK